MKARFNLIVFLGVLGLGMSDAPAVTVATPPAGCFRLDANGGRDNWLSAPLVRRSQGLRRVSAVGPVTLTLSDVNWDADAYAPTSAGAYYVQFVTGNLAGLVYKILGNTTEEVTVETQGDDLSAHLLGSIAAGESGDLIRIRPYWTVAGIFGATSGEVLLDPVPELTAAIYSEADSLLIPDNQSPGTEKSPAAVLAYVAGEGWRRRGQPTTEAGAAELPPGVPFLLRRQNVAPFSTFIVGYVSQEPGAIQLPALAAAEETDVYAALFHPATTRLADLGLADALENSPDAISARDLLLSPSDTRNGFSIPFARRFHLVGSAWYDGETPANDLTLHADTGYVIRLRGERPVRYWRQPRPN